MRLTKCLAAALFAVAVTACQTVTPDGPGLRLVMTGVGRFAVFADLATRSRSGDQARMRSLQVVEPGFEVDGRAFWGGWSWWAFDCREQTADRLDFASVSDGGVEGPVVPDGEPAYAAAPGGDGAELLAMACSDGPVRAPVFPTVEAAVVAGRNQMLSGN
jgi:hypothetical protein